MSWIKGAIPPILFTAILLQACGNILAGPMASPDNHIEIGEQGISVSAQGDTTIGRVVAAQPGWLCVQADLLGGPGRVLGCTAISSGESHNIPVTLDMSGLSWTLHASLYSDFGTPSRVEVPDPDVPVLTALGRPVTSEAILLADPDWITVSDQALGSGNRVTIERVFAPAPAILVIHDRRDEHVLGYKAVQVGENLNVPITLEPRGQIKNVFAELHWDVTADGELNLSDPAAHVSSGEFLMADFVVE